MNALMRINIRVTNLDPGTIRQVQDGIKQIRSQAAGSLGTMDKFGSWFSANNLEKFGKNLQWTGRQLEYNFTLPLGIAAAAAGKWALENEAAVTQVRKVYGLVGDGAQAAKSDVDQLAVSFQLLSNMFGVHQKEVIEIGKDWAEAGAAGVGLARDVRETLQAMIVGSMTAKQATEGLIAIQSAYQLSTQELHQELANLDIIQVQSGINFQGLIEVVQRAGGAARFAGIDIRHLAAMAGALVPATGSAAAAGNSLRTIISRLMSPTKDATDIFAKMGINIFDATWQAKNGVQRLEAMAAAFEKLSTAQRTQVATLAASRWQINRFEVLMADLVNKTGFYQRALEATADPTKALAVYSGQLTTVLESNPQKLKILWTVLQNAMADVVIPLLPLMLSLVTRIVGLISGFSNLSPAVQQLIIAGLGVLAVLGPIIRYFGAWTLLISQVMKFAGWLSTILFGELIPAKAAAATAAAAEAAAEEANGVAMVRTAGFVHILGDAFMWLARLPFRAIRRGMDLLFGNIDTAGMFTTQAAAAQASTTVIVSAYEEQAVAATGAYGVAGEALAGLGAEQTTFLSATGAGWAGTMSFIEAQTVIAGDTITTIWVGTMSTIMSTFPVVASGLALTMGTVVLEITSGLQMLAIEAGATMQAIPATTSEAFSTALVVIRGAASQAVVLWSVAMQEMGIATEGILPWVQATMAEVLMTMGATVGPMALGMGEVFLALPAMTAEAAGTSLAVIDVMVAQTVTVIESSGLIWIGTLGSIVAANVVAGSEVTTVWVATAASIDAALMSIPVVAGAAAAATVLELEAIPAALALGMGEAAGAVVGETAILGGAMTDAMMGAATGIARIWYFITGLIGEGIGFLLRAVLAIPELIGSAFSALAGVAAIVSEAIAGIAAALGISVGAVVAIIAAIVVAVGILAYVFRGSLGDAISWIKNQFEQLPGVILRVFQAIVRTIATAARAVRDWLKEMNPFQRHSPSLVDNVKKGTSIVGDKYSDMASNLSDAQGAHRDFVRSTAGSQEALDRGAFANQRADIIEMSPGSADEVDHMIAAIARLKGNLSQLDDEINKQQDTVDAWNKILELASRELTNAQHHLEDLQHAASDLKDELDNAQRTLDNFANTPIQGMKAMQNQIFANEMQQKQLRLEVLKLEDAYGSVDKIKRRMAELQGAIESVRAEQIDLREAGAGSDILGPLNDQIAELTGQANNLQDTSNMFQTLQDQIDALAHAGEELNLTESLQFDPLKRQIDDASKSMQEMPFDQIMAGITTQKALVADLTTQWQAATDAVDAQQEVVDALKAHKDMLQASYDVENEKLQDLKDNYGIVKDQIDKMTGAMSDFAAAARAAKEAAKQSDAEKLFDAGAGQDFDIPGGTGGVGAEFDQSIEEFNRQLQEEINKTMGDLGKIDLFGPFKDGWNAVWGAITGSISTVIGWVVTGVEATAGAIWDALLWGAQFVEPALKPIADVFEWLWTTLVTVVQTAWNLISPVWHFMVDFITGYIIPVFQLLIAIATIVFVELARIVLWMWETTLSPVFAAIDWTIRNVLMPAWDFLWEVVVKPAVDSIGAAVSALWYSILKPIWDLMVWTFDNVLAPAWDGFGKIIGGVGEVIKGVWDSVWETTKSIVNKMIDAFNFVVEVVDTIASALHISVSVSKMKHIGEEATSGGGGGGTFHMLAGGGALGVGAGWVTNRPKAIVGEGNRMYPEYVIPTDPMYKTNAIQLFMQLAENLDMPMMAGGGVLGRVRDFMGNVGDKLGDVITEGERLAIKAILTPGMATVSEAIGLIPAGLFRDMANGVKNTVYDMIVGSVPHLANGGVIGARPGGMLALLGDGPRSERVTVEPLPTDTKLTDGSKTMHFHGNLVFPNVKNGDDAEDFVRNLQNLS